MTADDELRPSHDPDEWLILAFDIERGRAGPAADIDQPVTPESWRWVHLDREVEGAHDWLRTKSGIPELAADALLDEATRPRLAAFEGGFVLFLRAVNLNPGADPEDMVTVRLWIEPTRIITLRRRRVMALEDLIQRCQKGLAPSTPGHFVAALADLLVERAEEVIDDFGETLERLEMDTRERSDRARQRALMRLQRALVPFRRYLSPQRDALTALSHVKSDILSKRDRQSLKETNAHLSRMIEDMTALSELARLLHDELTHNRDEELNRAAYTLAMISAVFLPLTFVTGLMGMNVQGIPGAEHPIGFWLAALVCLGIAMLTLPAIALLQRVGRQKPRRPRLHWRTERAPSSETKEEDAGPRFGKVPTR